MGARMGKAFRATKGALVLAPALGLLDYPKPFDLYVHMRKRVANGVLTQKLGPHQRPVAYYSVQLDLMAPGTPTYIRSMSVAATIGEKLSL